MVDMGFVFDGDGAYNFYEDSDPFDFGFSFLISTEKNYPDFDVYKDIPWSSFPGYIQDIIYMPLDDLNAAVGDGFVVPFVGVQVTTDGTVANVFVGTNVGLGFINNGYLSYSIFSVPYVSDIALNSKLYRLRVDLVNGNIVDWTEYKGEAYGNNGHLLRMLSWNTGNDSAVDDWYLYGANGVQYPNKSTSSYYVYNSSNNNSWVGFYTYKDGFKSGRFLYNQNQGYPYTYFQYFEPPSRESLQEQLQREQNETSKSILERIKELPTNIANSIKGFFTSLGDRISGFFTKLVEDIKGLFIPSDGFFDTYQQEFQTYFKDKFGILYEIPELIISLLQKFITFNPKDGNYSITFPEVKLPVQEDGEWREETLIAAQDFSFDFINEAPFSLLYDAYVAFIWLVYIMLLVNLIKNKANGVFKGG